MSSVTKLLLVTLADHANDAGECWPGHDRLADLCGCTRRSVINHLEKLKELGFIQIEPRFRDGMKVPSLYRLNMSLLPDVKDVHIDMSDVHIDVKSVHARCEPLSDQCERGSHKTPIKHPVKLYGGGSTRSTSLEDDLKDTTWAR